jgi:hypothetical protein
MDWQALLAHVHWHLYLWALIGILFAFAEFYAVFKGRKYATFTYLVKRGIPRWLVAAILGWLCYHFLIQS